jgi:hypothetical protein
MNDELVARGPIQFATRPCATSVATRSWRLPCSTAPIRLRVKRGAVWVATRPADLHADPERLRRSLATRAPWAMVVARAKRALLRSRTFASPEILVFLKWMIDRIVVAPDQLRKV